MRVWGINVVWDRDSTGDQTAITVDPYEDYNQSDTGTPGAIIPKGGLGTTNHWPQLTAANGNMKVKVTGGGNTAEVTSFWRINYG